MIIDLHELLQEDNGNRSYHLQLEADVFETSTASYKIKDYDLQLSFHNEGKKHISSRCEGFVVLEIPCDRCLEPVDYKIDIDYFKDLDMNKTAEEKIAELEGLKALVVDDDFNTCDSVTKMLVRVGMRSEWTLSGKEAVLRARQSMELGDAFHAYIIDWRLPDMNGIEVTRQIRSLGDDTPIIILTAYDWSDIEVEARAAGVTAFCAKPLFMSDIRDTLMTAIGQMQAETEDTPLSAAGSDFRDKCILLVEDNELNREITVEILNEYGCMVDTAENGAEAVEKVKNSKPGNYDLVLMDVQMPVMNGYEATKQIRALNDPELAGITILAMTANAFDEDRKKALECGMDGFLTKPIVIEELIGTLQKNLD